MKDTPGFSSDIKLIRVLYTVTRPKQIQPSKSTNTLYKK